MYSAWASEISLIVLGVLAPALWPSFPLVSRASALVCRHRNS